MNFKKKINSKNKVFNIIGLILLPIIVLILLESSFNFVGDSENDYEKLSSTSQLQTKKDLLEEKELGLLQFSLIKGDFRRFEGSWKIKNIKDTSKNSLIYDLTVQGCQWMPIGMIEKRLKKDLSENLVAVDMQAKSSINLNSKN